MSESKNSPTFPIVSLLFIAAGLWLITTQWPSFETVLSTGYLLGIGSTLGVLTVHQVLADD